MKVEKLKLSQIHEPEPINVYGVAAGLDLYRMAYFLEKILDQEIQNLKIKEFTESEITYYKIEKNDSNLYLVKNQLPEGYFFPKAKMADYIIVVLGPNAQLFIERIKNDLTKVASVQSIFAIEDKFLTKSKLKYLE